MTLAAPSKAEPIRALPGGLQITRPSAQAAKIKQLVHGYSGVGKTTYAASANDDERSAPAILFDFEAGTLSVAHKNIDVVRITDFKQFNELYPYLEANPDGYKTAIFDSITEIQKLNMTGIVAAGVAANPSKDPDRPLIDDWGKSIEQIRKLLRYFRDLPLHIVVVALSQEVRDERDGTIQTAPALPGKLSLELPGMFDIVGYMAAGEVTVGTAPNTQREFVRQMLLAPTPRYIAKWRDPRGISHEPMQNPTFSKILDEVDASVKPPSKK